MQHFSEGNATDSGHGIVPLHSVHRDLLTYCTNAAASHLTNASWHIDSPGMDTCDSSAVEARKTNAGFFDHWDRMKQSKEIQLYGRLHALTYNVPLYLLLNVRLDVKLRKYRQSFSPMNKEKDSKVAFKFLDPPCSSYVSDRILLFSQLIMKL
jgi:hypothetical protein